MNWLIQIPRPVPLGIGRIHTIATDSREEDEERLCATCGPKPISKFQYIKDPRYSAGGRYHTSCNDCRREVRIARRAAKAGQQL